MHTAIKQCDTVYNDWMKFHKCISKYPDTISQKFLDLSTYEWVKAILSSRCFQGPSDISVLIPLAELINHENVKVTFDFFVSEREISELNEEELKLENVLSDQLKNCNH